MGTAAIKTPGLTLVTDGGETATQRSPAEQVFDHWVWMTGKNPRRVAFGPDRRRAVDKALALYDIDVLLAAIEGCASHPHNNGDNARGEVYDDLELILRNEAQIERFARRGDKLRAAVVRARAREAAAAAQPGPHAPADDPADAVAMRALLRAMAVQLSGRGGRG